MIWEELEGLNITDDTLLDYDFIKDKVISWNNTLVTEAYTSKLPMDGYYQFLDCIEVECAKGSCVLSGITFTRNEVYYIAEFPPLNKVVKEPIRYFGRDRKSVV